MSSMRHDKYIEVSQEQINRMAQRIKTNKGWRFNRTVTVENSRFPLEKQGFPIALANVRPVVCLNSRYLCRARPHVLDAVVSIDAESREILAVSIDRFRRQTITYIVG